MDTEPNQAAYAQELAEDLQSWEHDITTLDLLDCLANCGLTLQRAEGMNDASLAYIAALQDRVEQAQQAEPEATIEPDGTVTIPLQEDDVAEILGNPFYAVQIHPAWTQPHPTLVSEEMWVAANTRYIEEHGASDWLLQLLLFLKGDIGLTEPPVGE
jgi:hypothetical protein